MASDNDYILEIEDLKTYIYDAKNRGFHRLVDGASFRVPRGKTSAVVGESGSGKSSVAYSLLGLVPDVPGVISGRMDLTVDGERFETLSRLPDACRVEEREGVVRVAKDGRRWRKQLGYEAMMQRVRGRHISLMMQEARSALNPYQPIRQQVREAYLIGGGDEADADEMVGFLFKELHIFDKADAFPHNLSGGTCHRAMMAVAFASNPDLLIADEPTTGLDCPIQIKVVDLLQRFKEGELMPNVSGRARSMLLVSHQIEIVETLSDDVVVMYGGKVVETGTADEILEGDIRHPYTEKIVQIYREPPELSSQDSLARLVSIPGFVPSTLTWMKGCRFANRCESRMAVCDRVPPPLLPVGEDSSHCIACHLYHEGAAAAPVEEAAESRM